MNMPYRCGDKEIETCIGIANSDASPDGRYQEEAVALSGLVSGGLKPRYKPRSGSGWEIWEKHILTRWTDKMIICLKSSETLKSHMIRRELNVAKNNLPIMVNECEAPASHPWLHYTLCFFMQDF
ncbi:hypothetical protein LIER_38156 [Lithospermum erythrorhizon]|uniref:Uncharacterized protein n=1 Tax=Lithospermum erythrorhizon TaxID=34254 RepID=A0AAV3PVW4_LITER